MATKSRTDSSEMYTEAIETQSDYSGDHTHTDYYSVPAHQFTESSTTEAVRCNYCDHECLVELFMCCFCKEDIPDESETYLPRTRTWGIEAEEHSNAVFHRFPELPIELRLRIWKFALPGPRVVFLEACYLDCIGGRRPPQGCVAQDEADIPFELPIEHVEGASSWVWKSFITPIGFRSYASFQIPFVCREAFDVASGIYAVTFGSIASLPMTWFDFKLDTLYLDLGCSYRVNYDLENIQDLAKVENLALFMPEYHADLTQSHEDIREDMACFIYETLLPIFRSLKHLSFVLKRHDPGETNLIFDPKTYDVDRCIDFYSRRFDRFLIAEHYDTLAHAGLIIPHKSLIARLAHAMTNQAFQLPEISSGVITTPPRKLAREKAYNSWMLQRMADDTPPLEYRFSFHCIETAATLEDMLPEQYGRLGHVMMNVMPETPVHVLQRSLREYWNTPDNFDLKLTCAGFWMQPEQIVGHLEFLAPQERNGPVETIPLEQPGHMFRHNIVHVSYVERSSSAIRKPLDNSASDLILFKKMVQGFALNTMKKGSQTHGLRHT